MTLYNDGLSLCANVFFLVYYDFPALNLFTVWYTYGKFVGLICVQLLTAPPLKVLDRLGSHYVGMHSATLPVLCCISARMRSSPLYPA
jgi:hypothetical protein